MARKFPQIEYERIESKELTIGEMLFVGAGPPTLQSRRPLGSPEENPLTSGKGFGKGFGKR
jgi:hypothetical protein